MFMTISVNSRSHLRVSCQAAKLCDDTRRSLMFLAELNGQNETHSRQKRYLVFPPATQWGVFAAISIPLHPENTVSLAWFFEVNYFTVDNVTYLEPLLGDIAVSRQFRSDFKENKNAGMFRRATLYTFVETMLQRHGYPGRACLLRAVCENASAMFPHNGVLGDLMHLLLTPSTSMAENDLEDIYYKAEYYGLEEECERYKKRCPESPLDVLSIIVENVT